MQAAVRGLGIYIFTLIELKFSVRFQLIFAVFIQPVKQAGISGFIIK